MLNTEMMQGDAKLFKTLKNKAVKSSIMLEASLSELQFQHTGGDAQTHILCLCHRLEWKGMEHIGV